MCLRICPVPTKTDDVSNAIRSRRTSHKFLSAISVSGLYSIHRDLCEEGRVADCMNATIDKGHTKQPSSARARYTLPQYIRAP
eukprot:538827-Pyramimonas_sp.AAC.1